MFLKWNSFIKNKQYCREDYFSIKPGGFVNFSAQDKCFELNCDFDLSTLDCSCFWNVSFRIFQPIVGPHGGIIVSKSTLSPSLPQIFPPKKSMVVWGMKIFGLPNLQQKYVNRQIHLSICLRKLTVLSEARLTQVKILNP